MSPQSQTWKSRLRNALPSKLVEEVLLAFPALYRMPVVRYETNMAGGKGLEDLLSQLDLTLGVEGDVVECGSDLAGTTVILARRIRERAPDKTLFACDSFEGFDRGELEREREQGWTDVEEDRFTKTSLPYVRRKIRRLGVESTVRLVPGYFQDTLEELSGPVSFVFIDCDLKDSLVYCAETLWPRLRPGGRMTFDDYAAAHFRGAKLGIDEFVERHRDEIADHGFLNRVYFVARK